MAFCNTLELLANLRDALSDRLKELRKRVGWDQHDLAVASDLAVGTIRGYEQKTRWPDPEELEKMANALSVRAIDLLMFKEDLRPHSADQALSVLADFVRKHSSNAAKEQLLAEADAAIEEYSADKSKSAKKPKRDL